MRILPYIPTFVLSCILIVSSVRYGSADTDGVLTVHLALNGNQIDIGAEYNNSSKSFTLSKNKNGVLQDFNELYNNLQNRKAIDVAMKSTLVEYGKLLFDPIKSYVESSSEIVFVIPREFIKFPLDLIYFEGNHLFLQKPVAYSFSKVRAGEFKFSEGWSALIISDPTADPENGCYILKEMLPSSNYYKIGEMTIKRLETMGETDLLLISAHGEISLNSQDHIKMGKEKILPYDLWKLKPRLVYLDACQLGVSWHFVEGFQANGTEYYIAPIISNEAGNSSTKTIRFFFEGLKLGNRPAFALFTARKRLYERFQGLFSLGITLWRSYPFRIYLLN